MTKIKCAKCEEVLRGVCIDCKGTYHRKCEKVKAGEGKSDVCKGCERKKRIPGDDNVVEANAAEVRIVEPGRSEVSLRSEIESLKSEIASLKEIIRVLSEEKEVAPSVCEEQWESGWTVSREKTKRQGTKSANFLELKNGFETLTKSPSKDNLTSKANDKAKQATKPHSKTKQTKQKVLAVADSNGRG